MQNGAAVSRSRNHKPKVNSGENRETCDDNSDERRRIGRMASDPARKDNVISYFWDHGTQAFFTHSID